MKTKEIIKYFLCCGALIYTVGSVLILAISLAASESAAATILAPKPFLFFFGFSYIISLGNTLMRIDSISNPIRRLLHALCYIIGFFVFVLLCGVEFAFSVIFAAVFGAIYAIVTVTSSVIKKQTYKSNRNNTISSEPSEKKASAKTSKRKKAPGNTYQSRFS